MTIYLTEEDKKELEDKIAELKKPIAHHDGVYVSDSQTATIECLEELLSQAVILPVDTSYKGIKDNIPEYENGVIIQNKE